uniref:MATH domain-containing protein n=1 Tax=Leersia perrieri TaxID=77586 RepID=A0A0D9W2W3_9ORYZ
MSLFLQLADAPDEDVHFEYKFMFHAVYGEGLEFMSSAVRAVANKQQNAHGFKRFVSREDLSKRGYVKLDHMTIRCDVTVFQKKKRPLSHETSPPAEPRLVDAALPLEP